MHDYLMLYLYTRTSVVTSTRPRSVHKHVPDSRCITNSQLLFTKYKGNYFANKKNTTSNNDKIGGMRVKVALGIAGWLGSTR